MNSEEFLEDKSLDDFLDLAFAGLFWKYEDGIWKLVDHNNHRNKRRR